MAGRRASRAATQANSISVTYLYPSLLSTNKGVTFLSGVVLTSPVMSPVSSTLVNFKTHYVLALFFYLQLV